MRNDVVDKAYCFISSKEVMLWMLSLAGPFSATDPRFLDTLLLFPAAASGLFIDSYGPELEMAAGSGTDACAF